ncbi:hypothetical protein [Salicola sp. Rm-C-2C1-2]|uniref:hypothetical protein n=1 Tax=Salicola sp. Rm-C-2C1-2 TaxID=3141321 RepID=UPI0032E39197
MSDSKKTAHEVMAEIRQRYADNYWKAHHEHELNKRSSKLRDMGRKGGSVSKRKLWAQQVAEFLADEFSGYSFKEIWAAIPESSAPLCIEGDEYDLGVYRDGQKLIATNYETTAELGDLGYDTFEKKYFRPARNTGT